MLTTTNNTLPPCYSQPRVPFASFVSSPNTRGTIDLLWSCFLTIFLCTWSVQRLEMPSPRDTAWQRFRRKLAVTTFAVIAPEGICQLSAEEWVAALLQVRRFHDHGFPWWTMKHAFFSYMGGFALDFGDGKETIVMEDQIIYLVERNLIVLEKIPESDIANVKFLPRSARTTLRLTCS